MRESRTYGSVRGGGREVTRVPTANGSPNGCIESKTEVLGTSVSSLLHLNEQTLAELMR